MQRRFGGYAQTKDRRITLARDRAPPDRNRRQRRRARTNSLSIGSLERWLAGARVADDALIGRAKDERRIGAREPFLDEKRVRPTRVARQFARVLVHRARAFGVSRAARDVARKEPEPFIGKRRLPTVPTTRVSPIGRLVGRGGERQRRWARGIACALAR